MILYNLSRIVSALSFLSWRFSTEPRFLSFRTVPLTVGFSPGENFFFY
jgi:hypothetical protein